MKTSTNKNITKISASTFANKIKNGVMNIPAELGSGYIKGYIINPDLRIIVRQYELTKELMLDRGIDDNDEKFVMIAFHNIYNAADKSQKQSFPQSVASKLLPSVQVATTGFNNELLPASRRISSIVVTVSTAYLKILLRSKTENSLLQLIISADQPFLFEELISPEIQDAASEVVIANPAEALQELYYKVKAEELIYLLFAELLKRQQIGLQTLHVADVKQIYLVKEMILSNIGTPPKVPELVKLSGMSESKLKRLFKQVFGNSIYDYYQSYRMKEAAYLLREHRLSVSEVGYQLGFSNLSHFSRLFERYIGSKPKKYSKK